MTSALSLVLSILALLLVLCLVAMFCFIYAARHKPKSALNNLDYLLVYASQSGQAEQYAKHTATGLIHSGYSVGLISIDELNQDILLSNQTILWMVSTYGEGDGPDTAQPFIEQFFSQTLNLHHQRYAILALGDRRYANFCSFGQGLEQWLNRCGAQALFTSVHVDQMQAQDLAQFAAALSRVAHISLAQYDQAQTWHDLKLQKRQLLNAGSQGTGLYHLQFSLDEHIDWQSGDIALIQCMNTATQIAEFIQKYQLNPEIAEQLRSKNLRSIEDTPFDVNTMTTWPDLPQREYSIASLRNEQHLDLVVRYQVDGLGSSLLTQHLGMHDSIQIAIRANPSFHLDALNTPCIFIGNGSGIAGLMAHLKQRQLTGQHQNWLIYGERQQAFDAIFNEQLTVWQQGQHLTHLDRVYSRDGQQDRYVQDILLRQADRLKDWVAQGAKIYVCGSVNGMAQGVDDALLQVLGQAVVANLKKQQRYLRDVY